MAYLKATADGRVIGFSPVSHPDFPIEYDFQNSNITLEEFLANGGKYRLFNGTLVYYNNSVLDETYTELLAKRKTLFNEYVDRSPMWYAKLTPEQLQELKEWYDAWCDMPQSFLAGTWQEPSLPVWLNKIE